MINDIFKAESGEDKFIVLSIFFSKECAWTEIIFFSIIEKKDKGVKI